MGWSKWYRLTKNNVENHACNEKGIYRIALSNRKCFKKAEITGGYAWRLLRYLSSDIADAIVKRYKGAIRVAKYNGGIYTNLAYIGKAANVSVRTRLGQHIDDPNDCLRGLMKTKDVALYFSCIKATDPACKEQNFYQEFVDATGGICPPADKGSNECSKANGEEARIYILVKTRKKYLC